MLRWKIPLILTAVFFAASGCASRVPKDVVSRVNFAGNFSDLKRSPDRYKGQFAILGGRVIEIKGDSSGSTMAVLQYPLDSSHRPNLDEPSGGRFLVRSSSFLDPALYSAESLVTVAGTLSGQETLPVGEYPYPYPVINMDQIWKWETIRPPSYPAFQFGVGFGTYFD